MRAFVAVFSRELAERRLLALLGLLGVVPLIFSISGLIENQPDDRGTTALILCAVTSGVVALVVGGSVIARDLAERRLGFYFSRPIPGWAVWAGKLGAGFALSLGIGLLTLLPTALRDGGTSEGTWALLGGRPLSWGGPVSLWILGALLLLLGGHGVSLLARSRTPWLGLDVAAFAAVFLVTSSAWHRLVVAGAIGPAGPRQLDTGLLALLVALLLALLAAAGVQVTRGRTDLPAGHRLFSLTLWSLVLATALAFTGFSRWMVAASPSDLLAVESVQPSPTGSWCVVRGPVAHRLGYAPEFLLDAASGRFVRLGAASGYVFSADGRHVAIVDASQGRREAALLNLDLDPRPGSHGRTPSVLSTYPTSMALSPGGSLLATVQENRLLVQQVAGGKLIAAEALPGYSSWLDAWFAGPRRVRVGRTEARLQRIVELDLDSRALFTSEVLFGSPAFLATDGERLLVVGDGRVIRGRAFLLMDARTGKSLTELAPASQDQLAAWPLFLSDGRIAHAGETGAWLRLLDRDGNEIRRYRLPGASLTVEGEAASGRLVVTTSPGRGAPGTVRLLDLASGGSRVLGQDLRFVRPPGAVRTATVGPLLFERAGGELLWLDPRTMTLRVVLRGLRS